jgi:hypothetical protein
MSKRGQPKLRAPVMPPCKHNDTSKEGTRNFCQVATVSEDNVDSYTLVQTLWLDEVVEELSFFATVPLQKITHKDCKLQNQRSKVLLYLSRFERT